MTNDLYVSIKYLEINSEEDTIVNDEKIEKQVEDDILIIQTNDQMLLEEPESFIEALSEDLQERFPDKTLVFNAGELYQIIPGDPLVDTMERVEDIREKFQYIDETYMNDR